MIFSSEIMKKYLIFIILYASLFFAAAKTLNNNNNNSQKRKIAIIGAGIGGTSCAYFLNELLVNYATEIHIYEHKNVGGRLAVIRTNNNQNYYEIGGSIIHNGNQYMSEFVQKFGLSKKSPNPSKPTAIYDGRTLNMRPPTSMSPHSLQKLKQFLIQKLNLFGKIYVSQKQMDTFRTVGEMINSMDQSLLELTEISTEQYFRENLEIPDNDVIMKSVVETSLIANYGQTKKISAFVGFVSISPLAGGMYAIDGGNYLVAIKCLKQSGAKLFTAKVVEIKRLATNKFVIRSINRKTKRSNNPITYDYVIIATPLITGTTGIKFQNFGANFKIPTGLFRRTVTTILEGNLKSSGFQNGSAIARSVDIVYFLNNGIMNSVAKQESSAISSLIPIPILGLGQNVWKIFSKIPLKQTDLVKYFEVGKIIKVMNWLAYPIYKTTRQLHMDKFVLGKNLFYINCIEWAASCMEMSVIAAKNVALLVYKTIKGK